MGLCSVRASARPRYTPNASRDVCSGHYFDHKNPAISFVFQWLSILYAHYMARSRSLARGLSSLVSRVPSARRGRRRVLASALHQRDRFAHTYITHPHLTHKLHMAAGCPLSAPWLWCAARCRVALGCVVRPGRQGWHALIGGHAHPPATRLVPCNMRAHTATAASAGARRMTTGHAKAASAPSIDTAKKPMTK